MSGRVLKDRYELLKAVGSGAMGTVHEAWDRELERRVAIKLLAGGPSADARDRFVREAKLLARVHHPHVVGVFDAGTTESGDPFIVMELLVGDSLKARITQHQKIPVEQAIAYARDIARGLGAVHGAGLVHRDLKPANTMVVELEEGEVVKVLDLGVAHATDEETLSKSGNVVGTVLYIAPEQIRGGEVDHRADLYAFGATLFEMLEGKPPFMGPSIVETIHAHLYDPVPKMSPNVPASVVAIVKRCLAKTAAERYETARALEQALAAAQGGASASDATRADLVLPPLVDDAPAVSKQAGPLSDTRAVGAQAMAAASAGGPELDLPAAPPLATAPAEEPPPPPLDLAVDSVPALRAAPRPSELHDAPVALPAPLEVERDQGPVYPPMGPHPLVAPVYRDDPRMFHDPYGRYGAHPKRAMVPGPVAGVFAIFPVSVHQRLAVGASLLAIIGLAITGSVLLFLAFGLVAAFGIVGYYVRRRIDGYD
jgi:hypothetical protein